MNNKNTQNLEKAQMTVKNELNDDITVFNYLTDLQGMTIDYDDDEYLILKVLVNNSNNYDVIGYFLDYIIRFYNEDDEDEDIKPFVEVKYLYDYVDTCHECNKVIESDYSYYMNSDIVNDIMTDYHEYEDFNNIPYDDIDNYAIDFINGFIQYDEVVLCEACYDEARQLIYEFLEELNEELESTDDIDDYEEHIEDAYNLDSLKGDYHEYNNIIMTKGDTSSRLSVGFECEHEFNGELPEHIINELKPFYSIRYGLGLFRPEYDGSLSRYSMESPSATFYGNSLIEHLDDLNAFFNILTPYFECTGRCGGHIHIGLQYLSNDMYLSDLEDFINNNKKLFILLSGRIGSYRVLDMNDHELYDYFNDHERGYYYLDDSRIYHKYYPIHKTSKTLEFRFFNTYKNTDSILRRLNIALSLLDVFNLGDILDDLEDADIIKMWRNTIEFNASKYDIDMSWYINKINKYLDYIEE